MYRSASIVVLGFYIRSVFEKDLNKFNVSLVRRYMQRGFPVYVYAASIYVLRVLDNQECSNVGHAAECSIMQRCRPNLSRKFRPIVSRPATHWVVYRDPDSKVALAWVKQTLHPIIYAWRYVFK